MKSISFYIILFLVFNVLTSQAQSIQKHPAGKIMIVGGGSLDDVFSRFISEAGGPDASIVIIPTASGREDLEDEEVRNEIQENFRQRGANNVGILHTYSRREADSPTFAEPIKTADAVWFTGGRQWRLVDAYSETLVVDEIGKLLDRGGIIGGTSAGATIMGSYLARGDTKSNLIMMGDHEEGFGFLTNMAIDQHVLVRNRQFDMFVILEKNPELLGIGLDEGTALLFYGDTAEVIGPGYVLVYDGTMWQRDVGEQYALSEGERKFYCIREGMLYDIRKRRIIAD